MQVFNLTQYAGIKADKYIQSHCGGRYTRKEAYNIGGIGIGRLRYRRGISAIDNLDTQEQFRANLETFRQGLGVYVRSLTYNFLLTIPRHEILSVSLIKQEDRLMTVGFSWTQKLLALGMPYHYARVMLLEHEIAEVHDPHLYIVTLAGEMKFLVKRADPTKLLHYFKQGPLQDIFTSDIKGYQYID